MIDIPVEVKDALREGRLKKNYRMVVLNDDSTEDFTIDNDTLVSESVSIDERMCSGDTIKFGLCEGSSLEFQYFNHPNITDRQVKVFCDVDYGANQPYSIPMGFFTVKNCSRQASTGIIKVTAYNKLQSDYLDAKANDLIAETPSDMSDGSTTLFSILEKTLNDYGINNRTETELSVYIQHYQGGSYTDISSVSISINGYSGTYFPSIYKTNDYYCRVTTTIPEGSMLSLDLTEFVGLLQRSVIGMKTAFYNNVIDAESKWNSAVQDYGMLQHNACMVVGFYNDNYVHFYTLPSEVRTSPSAHNHPIESIMNLYNVRTLSFVIPYKLYAAKSNHTNDVLLWTNSESFNIDILDGKLKMIMASELTDAELINVDVNNLPDVTLRELQTAVYETEAQFGKLDRVTDLFSGVELNHSRLLPADSLYPDNALYPDGAQESAFRSQYSKLWADEGNIHKWRYLIITYKGLDGEGNETEYTLQRTVNNDGTDNYNCSDNWLFRNLVWTAEQIGTYADAMVAKMRDITWFPFEMWCAGLPYLETGDEIEIPLGSETYTSYILQRQLKGIQNLQDTYINGTLDIF